jgi:hypothetical protein
VQWVSANHVYMALHAERWVLACLCGVACAPRSEPLEPGECGSVSVLREPNQLLEDRPIAPIASYRAPDGTARILLGPIIRRSSNAPVQDLDPEKLKVSFESEPPVLELTVGRVTPDDPAELDVVLLLDTSSTMGWAIEAARATVGPFAEHLQMLGFEPRFGGLEFGDELRTRSELAGLVELEQWLDTLSPIGGGDAPSSGLDAVGRLPFEFGFRQHVARYVVLVTRSGLHELDDGSMCANLSFFAATSFIRASTFVVALYPEGRLVGIHPERLTDAVGGLAVPIAASERDKLLSLPSVAEIMGQMYSIVVQADAVPADALSGSITYPLDGEELSLGFGL